MTSNKHKILSGALNLFLGNNLLRAAEFIGTIFLARHIGPEAFGQIGYIISIEMMFWSFMMMHPPLAIIRESENAIDYAKTVLGVFLSLSFLMTIIVIVASFFLPKFDATLRFYLMILILAKLPDSIATSIYAPFLDKSFLFTRKALIETAPMLLGIATACVMVLRGFKIEALVARYAVDHIVRFILVLFLSPHLFLPTIKLKDVKSFLRFNFFIGTSIFLRDTCNSIATFLFANVSNMRELGLYNRGSGLSTILASTLTGWVSSVLPSVASKKKNDANFLLELFETVIGGTFRCFLLVIILLLFCGKMIIELLYGSQWSGAVIYLQLASIFALSQILIEMTNSFHSMSADPRNVTKTHLYRAISFIVFCWILIPFFKHKGIVYAIILSSFLASFYSIYQFNLKIRVNIAKTFMFPALIFFMTCIFYLFSSPFIPSFNTLFFNVLFTSFLLVIVFLVLSLLFDLSNYKKYYYFLFVSSKPVQIRHLGIADIQS